MCLALPGQIVELRDREAGIALVDLSGVRREVNVSLADDPGMPLGEGDWVLVHVGFALARIDEGQARDTLALLRQAAALQAELDEVRRGTVT